VKSLQRVTNYVVCTPKQPQFAHHRQPFKSDLSNTIGLSKSPIAAGTGIWLQTFRRREEKVSEVVFRLYEGITRVTKTGEPKIQEGNKTSSLEERHKTTVDNEKTPLYSLMKTVCGDG
jgi:hypothetical protein